MWKLNYIYVIARKADLKDATGFDNWILLKKNGLGNLKSDVDKLDIDKLKNVPSGWSSLKSVLDKFHFDKLATVSVDLSDVVKNDVVRKTEYDELVKKVNAVPVI